MDVIVQFLLRHGYSVLFAALFAHQLGLPIPGPMFLLAAGALAGSGRLSMADALGLGIVACVLADCIWYEAGRRMGDKVLHFLHRFTRDPEFHNRNAKEMFHRFGPPLLLLCKFVPGLDAVVPPLAGTSRTSRFRFLVFETVGASLYSGIYAGLGHLFSHDLDRAAAYIGRVGTILAGLVFVIVILFAITRLFRFDRKRA